MTVKEIRDFCTENDIKPPQLRKEELIAYINGILSERKGGRVSVSRNTADITCIYPVHADTSIHYLDHLSFYGWCVVEIEGWRQRDHVSMFFDFMEDTCPSFRRDDRSTWLCKNMISNLHGIFKQYVGHLDLCWSIRELCAPIFAELYGIEERDLLCSFDGLCFMAPKKARTKTESWIHNDTPREYNRECYQGIVNFVDNGENDGGLVLVEGSPVEWESYLERHPSYGYSWGKADTSDIGLIDRRIIKVCAPAGHLILFDGRTFHANTQPTSNNYRLCSYVSMQPASWATDDELKKRVKMYEEGRMTGHWTSGPWLKATSKDPRSYGNELVKPREIEIAPTTPLMRRLIGY